jgi:spoIIIJ-associated protein
MDRQRGGGRFDRHRGPERPPQRQVNPNLRVPVSDEEIEDDNIGNRIDTEVALDPSLEAAAVAAGEHATPEDAVAPIAAEILQKILMRMKVRARIVRRQPSEEGDAAFPDDQSSVTLNITGLSERDQSNLIGRRGETLDALQFLVNLIVGRQTDLWTRVIIDIEGYRLRRKFALINLARRTADQVQARNQAIPLEAMPPYERRIIHMALAEHPAVVTESSGAEPERRVVVLPK